MFNGFSEVQHQRGSTCGVLSSLGVHRLSFSQRVTPRSLRVTNEHGTSVTSNVVPTLSLHDSRSL